MRLAIWLAIPVGLFIAAIGITVILAMANGTDACGTWMAVMMPNCG